MSVIDDLLGNARRYVAGFDKGHLPMPPARQLAIVACMDARLNPYGLLGLSEGDAHVIRNAGGVITEDAIRSLVISQRLLGTREIMLIHHSDCGMLTFTDDDFKAQIEADTGLRPGWAARVVPRSRRRCAAVHRAHRGQPVHPAQGSGSRLRVHRHRRLAHRNQLTRRTRRRGEDPHGHRGGAVGGNGYGRVWQGPSRRVGRRLRPLFISTIGPCRRCRSTGCPGPIAVGLLEMMYPSLQGPPRPARHRSPRRWASMALPRLAYFTMSSGGHMLGTAPHLRYERTTDPGVNHRRARVVLSHQLAGGSRDCMLTRRSRAGRAVLGLRQGPSAARTADASSAAPAGDGCTSHEPVCRRISKPAAHESPPDPADACAKAVNPSATLPPNPLTVTSARTPLTALDRRRRRGRCSSRRSR